MTNLPAQYFKVVVDLNPFSSVDRVEVNALTGLSLQELLELYVPSWEDKAEYLSFYVEGDFIPRYNWKFVKPKGNTTVVIKLFPKDPASLVLGLSSLLGGSSLLVTATGGLTLLGSVLAGAIGIGISLLASALFAPSTNLNTQIEEDPLYSISAQRNTFQRFQPVPVVLGRHRFVPPYGSSPYTEVDGDDQYLRILVVWGYGEHDVQDVKIGNTPIESYEDVTIQNDFEGDDLEMSLFPNAVAQEDLSIRLDPNYVSRSTPIECTEVGYTVTFPQGLYQVGSDGSRQDEFVVIYVELLNEVGSLLDSTVHSVTRATSQPVRISGKFTGLTKDIYQVRMYRDPAEAALSVSDIVDRCDWTALRAYDTTGPAINLAGVAKSAYRIRANDQLNGVIDQLNAVVSKKVPVWNGSTWTGNQVSSNPAAIYRYILTGGANLKAIPSSKIDDTALGAWYTFCEEKGFTYNSPIVSVRSIKSLLQDVASAGRASPAYVGEKWSIIIDRAKSTVVQHFTPRNTFNFSSEIGYLDYPEALRIPFSNEDLDYEEDEIVVYDTGYDNTNTTNYELIRLPGQTNYNSCYSLGRHYLASARLRPERFTFSVDVENLVATRGDLVRLTHDVSLIGQTSGRVVSASGVALVVDEEVTFEAGVTYTIRIRKSDGTTFTTTSSNISGFTGTSFNVDDTLTGVAAGDLFMFGEQDVESKELIVASIEYNDDLSATLTCVPYEVGVYSDFAIPVYTPTVSPAVSASLVGPVTPKILQVRTDESALQRVSRDAIQGGALLFLEPGDDSYTRNGRITQTRYFQIRWRETGSGNNWTYEPQIESATTNYLVSPLSIGGVYDIHVRALDAEGGTSYWSERNSTVILGGANPPGPVDTFRTSSNDSTTYIEWTDPDQDIDVLYYEIRYHPDLDHTNWATMTVVSDQVPFDARAFTVPSRVGTYAIKAVDFGGLRSTSALFANSTCLCKQNLTGGLNTVVSLTEEPTFTGTKTNMDVTGGDLVLSDSTVIEDWITLSSITALNKSSFTLDQGSYEFGETDLGAVYTTTIFHETKLSISSRIGFMSEWSKLSELQNMTGGVNAEAIDVEILFSYSTEDDATPSGASWSEYQRLVSADVTARHLRFKLNASTTDPYASPLIDQLKVLGTQPTRSTGAEDIVSGAATKSVTYSPAFNTVTGLTIGAQDMQTGDYYVINNKSRTGFDVTFKNSSGTNVSRTFDYTAVGYGVENGT